MQLFTDTFLTSMGEFSAAVNSRGGVVATAFGRIATLRTRLRDAELIPNASALRTVRDQVLAYLAGERRQFDIALAAVGTPFQQAVWAALLEIPYGETRSYADVAARLDRSRASRAVGRANATNPICLLVPCHRVIGADGSLTGFAFGESIKRRLLALEGAPAKP